jgi:hypothetical protein
MQITTAGDFIRVIDENEEVSRQKVWEIRADSYAIVEGELEFYRNGVTVYRTDVGGSGHSIKLIESGEFYGINLVDKDGNILWNPSHYSKYLDRESSLEKGYAIYFNPLTARRFTLN